MPGKQLTFEGGYVVNEWCHKCRRSGLICPAWGRRGVTVRMACVFCGKVEYRRWHKNSKPRSVPQPEKYTAGGR